MLNLLTLDQWFFTFYAAGEPLKLQIIFRPLNHKTDLKKDATLLHYFTLITYMDSLDHKFLTRGLKKWRNVWSKAQCPLTV